MTNNGEKPVLPTLLEENEISDVDNDYSMESTEDKASAGEQRASSTDLGEPSVKEARKLVDKRHGFLPTPARSEEKPAEVTSQVNHGFLKLLNGSKVGPSNEVKQLARKEGGRNKQPNSTKPASSGAKKKYKKGEEAEKSKEDSVNMTKPVQERRNSEGDGELRPAETRNSTSQIDRTSQRPVCNSKKDERRRRAPIRKKPRKKGRSLGTYGNIASFFHGKLRNLINKRK